jgi:hypothetical protein
MCRDVRHRELPTTGPRVDRRRTEQGEPARLQTRGRTCDEAMRRISGGVGSCWLRCGADPPRSRQVELTSMAFGPQSGDRGGEVPRPPSSGPGASWSNKTITAEPRDQASTVETRSSNS